MKILHTITSLDKGGAENHLAILAKQQVLNKNEVLIYTSKNSFYWLNFFKKNSIRVFKSGFYKEKNFLYKVFKLLFDILKLIRLIKEHKPNILHAHLPYMELVSYLSLLFVKENPKLIISKHLDFVFFNASDGQSKSIIGSLIARIISKKAVKIIAISKAVKFFLISNFVGIKKNKIELVYYGLDNINILTKKKDKKLILKKENGQLIIGCMARLVPQKSIQNILKALSLISDQNFKFLLVGNGPMKPELISLSRKLNIEKKIIWINFVDDIKSFYNTIDIFVLTSKYEGLGLVFLEAMMCKKPIIASNTSAMPEIIKNNYNGFLVSPNNSLMLSKLIIKLINPKLRLRLGLNGYKCVKKKFTVKKMYEETQRIYLSNE